MAIAHPLTWARQFCVRIALAAVPAKLGPVALTLHNIAVGQEAWLLEILREIGQRYGFLEPKYVRPDHAAGGRGVLLTFDDGFASNRRVAEKVLAPLGIRAVFFTTYDFIGLDPGAAREFAQRRFYTSRAINASDGDMSAMDWRDLEWLVEQGHEIGAHTASHPSLADLSDAKKMGEILDAADRLEQRLGRSVRQFAYPFGSLACVDEASVDIARGRFDVAFANVRGSLAESPTPHFLYRQNLVPGSPLWRVEAILEGRLDWRYRKVRREAQTRFALEKKGI